MEAVYNSSFLNISYYARFQSLISGVTSFAPKSVRPYAMLLLLTVEN